MGCTTSIIRTDFAEVKQEKPENKLKCGAFALYAILSMYNVLPKSTDPDKTIKTDKKEVTISGKDRMLEQANKIYTLTGDLTIGNTAGFNSPTALALAAREFGLKTRIYIWKKYFDNFYQSLPPAIKTIFDQEKLRAERNVCVCEVEKYELKGTTQTELHCVCSPTGTTTSQYDLNTLHWVARSTIGDFYDPADGLQHTDWKMNENVITNGENNKKYRGIGLWIRIEC